MKEILGKLCRRCDLSEEEARYAMSVIMEGEATPAQVAAFLVALKMKGETAEEIYGCARSMRERAVPVRTMRTGLTDTCGTGGDGCGTFNISTAAALVSAGVGLSVAKHGNRAVSSKCGSADVLEALGVNLELTPEEMGLCLDEVGIAFLYAPRLHQAMRHAAGPRREVGIRSVFNLLGPLTNPAGASRQLLGVYSPELAGCISRVLILLGVERAMVVHGSDGSDELTLSGETLVYEVRCNHVSSYAFLPEEAGLQRVGAETVRGGGPVENAGLIMKVLQGEKGPYRDVSVLNAAAALYISGMAENLRSGVALSQKAIDSGAALAKLEELRSFSERCGMNAQSNCS